MEARNSSAFALTRWARHALRRATEPALLAGLASLLVARPVAAEEPPKWEGRHWLELAGSASEFIPSCEDCTRGSSWNASLMFRWQHVGLGLTAYRWRYGTHSDQQQYEFRDKTLAPELRAHLFASGPVDVYAGLTISISETLTDWQSTSPEHSVLWTAKPLDIGFGASWFLSEHFRVGPRFSYRKVTTQESGCSALGAPCHEVLVSPGWLFGIEVIASALR
jgi:hypothetical protein